jgi:hypothetical protein
MSRINFDSLAKQNREYGHALQRFASWLDTHADARVITPMALARDLPDVTSPALAGTLILLVREGVLQRTYAVLTPDGVLAEGEFADPQDIPETLPDRFEHYFKTAEADIVPVYRMKR